LSQNATANSLHHRLDGSQLYRRGRALERVALFPPSLQTALQRPDALNALLAKEQCHTGAGGFVGSSTVKNYISITRQAVVLFLQLHGIHAECARNRLRVGFEIHGVPQINDDDIFATVDFCF
jgi:hypothetical protein